MANHEPDELRRAAAVIAAAAGLAAPRPRPTTIGRGEVGRAAEAIVLDGARASSLRAPGSRSARRSSRRRSRAPRPRGDRVRVFKPAVSGLDDGTGDRPTTSCYGARPAPRRPMTRSRSTGTARRCRPIWPPRRRRADRPDRLSLPPRPRPAGADLLVVEGVGGFLVPLTRSYLVRDFAVDLGLPVVIVAAPGLGTINHTLLTIEAARGGAGPGSPWSSSPVADAADGARALEPRDDRAARGRSTWRRCRARSPRFGARALAEPGRRPDAHSLRGQGRASLPVPTGSRRGEWTRLVAALDHRLPLASVHPAARLAAERPLVIECAEGTDLIDADGRRYIDGVSSLWCNVHGHRHPVIDEAVREQLDRVAHSTMLGLTHPARPSWPRGSSRSRRRVSRVFYSESARPRSRSR